jgi:BirA family biotin operon repressor/biotin-[acetyl-CoA-carboxylase] ligase
MSAPQPELDWATGALQAELQGLYPALQVLALASVDSTNSRLIERCRSGEPGPCLLVAEAQTLGRGRNGRAWHSQPGASLTFSIALPYAPPDWSGLSLAVGAALADAIEPLAPGASPRLQLKWPNDLWLAHDGAAPRRWRKLGGVLIETVAAAGGRACVVGIGLNVLPHEPLPELANGYACVQELDSDISAPRLLARVALPVLSALLRFEQQGLAPSAAAYARRDLLRGRPVVTSLAAVPDGVADGVDEQGALRVRHGGGVVAVSSGEVRVRPGPPPAEVAGGAGVAAEGDARRPVGP